MTSVGSSPHSSANPCMVSDSSQTSSSAFRLALTAMKERCQQLQNRLSMLEEENLQLRIERHSIPGTTKKDPETDSDVHTLLKKVEELTRQKSKLSHHIFLVANENKHLWEHLSKLTEDKTVETSHGGSCEVSKPKKSLSTILDCQDGNQLSLDEIPLRITTSQHKSPSSTQVDWNSSNSIKECEYPIMDVDVDDEAEKDGIVQAEIVEILANLDEEKKLLVQQQQGLKAAIEILTKFNKGHCSSCMVKNAEESRSTLDEYQHLHSMNSEIEETNRSEGEIIKVANGVTVRAKENNFEDRICPLCTKFYAKSTPFDEFNDHVLSHFVEDSEQDSHLSFHEIVA